MLAGLVLGVVAAGATASAIDPSGRRGAVAGDRPGLLAGPTRLVPRAGGTLPPRALPVAAGARPDGDWPEVMRWGLMLAGAGWFGSIARLREPAMGHP